ncbi:DUF4405 domain-containing protein [Halioxenophilus aromaticivorans]|uniref:DUF4405 domain-containing protein n=1 Tax=Halioxenophilus aromaticivorans TaxID=1306992 RepID=A0AAV3U467_9ALTE
MTLPRLARLLITLCATAGFITALAYWWLDNKTHELIGCAVLVLVITHTIINRRRFARYFTAPLTRRKLMFFLINVSMVLGLLIVATTGIAISQSVFLGWIDWQAAAPYPLHYTAAYWVAVLMGMHLGMNWNVITQWFRPYAQALPEILVTRLKWLFIAAILMLGIAGVVKLNLAAKLTNQPTLDLWDFSKQTPQFYLYWSALLGLAGVATRKLLK